MARGGRRSSKGRGRATTPARYSVVLSASALPRALLIGAIALLVCHAALSYYHFEVEEISWLLIQLFDVDQENNLPTWYSEFLLLTACALLWAGAQQKRADGDPWFRHWYVLAAGFLGLAIDEIAGIHESINSVIEITWAIPGGIAALVIGLAFVPFLLHLPRRTASLFAVAGAIYLAGGAGVEIVGNALVSQHKRATLEYHLTSLVEEGLEMFGVILFLYALLLYMRGPAKSGVEVSLEVR